MVFSYHQVQEHPKLVLAMTSLTQEEFHQLLPHFQYAWDQHVQQHYVDRDDRHRNNMAPGDQRPPWSLLRTSFSSFCIM